jgi:hypothetical protein
MTLTLHVVLREVARQLGCSGSLVIMWLATPSTVLEAVSEDPAGVAFESGEEGHCALRRFTSSFRTRTRERAAS